MVKVIVNGKEIELSGIKLDKITNERPLNVGDGVFDSIRIMIDTLADKGEGAVITELSKELVKLYPNLRGQERQRINNFVKNNSSYYEKRWSKETGLRTVVRVRKRK
jgi:hypothetical protein